MDKMDLMKRRARIAGLWYLLLAITSTFGLVYVPSKLIVAEEIHITVQNILASPMLYRLGILSNLIYLVVFVFLVLSFYHLFKEVNQKIAQIMVALVLVAVPVAFTNEIVRSTVLIILDRNERLNAFGASDIEAMVQLILSAYEYGSYMVMLFWGLWLFPLGILVIKSNFIPRMLGYFLIIGCVGYMVSSCAFLFSPSTGRIVFPIATLPAAFSEIAFILWLLIKGTKNQNAEIS